MQSGENTCWSRIQGLGPNEQKHRGDKPHVCSRLWSVKWNHMVMDEIREVRRDHTHNHGRISGMAEGQ